MGFGPRFFNFLDSGLKGKEPAQRQSEPFLGGKPRPAPPAGRREGRHVCRLHFSEQYFTFSQSLAHFLRHSNGRPQRSQTLGGNPFFVLASGVTPSGYPPTEKSLFVVPS